MLKLSQTEKRNRILESAIHEIAVQGYNAANVNIIAKKANVSIGTLYNYFHSKQDLLISIIGIGKELLNDVLETVKSEIVEGESFFSVLEKLFRITITFSEKYSELSLIYLDLSTEKFSEIASQLSNDLERNFIEFYKNIITYGKDRSELPSDLDFNLTAYFLDNLVIMLQFAYSSDYHKERICAYLGEDLFNDKNQLSRKLSEYCEKLLCRKG